MLAKRKGFLMCESAVGTFKLGITNVYKRLGQHTVANNSMMPEVKARWKGCEQALGPIATKCIENPKVPIDSKIGVARSVMLSRNTFAASAWPILLPREQKVFDTAIFHVWRRATSETCASVMAREQIMFQDS